MELAYAGLHQLCTPMLDELEALPEPQQVALRSRSGSRPAIRRTVSWWRWRRSA